MDSKSFQIFFFFSLSLLETILLPVLSFLHLTLNLWSLAVSPAQIAPSPPTDSPPPSLNLLSLRSSDCWWEQTSAAVLTMDCWSQAVKHPDLQRLRLHGYGKLLAEVQARTLKPRSDLLTQSLVSSFLLMTSPSPPLSVSLALSLSCQLPPLCLSHPTVSSVSRLWPLGFIQTAASVLFHPPSSKALYIHPQWHTLVKRIPQKQQKINLRNMFQ